jgi:hypothetical protein
MKIVEMWKWQSNRKAGKSRCKKNFSNFIFHYSCKMIFNVHKIWMKINASFKSLIAYQIHSIISFYDDITPTFLHTFIKISETSHSTHSHLQRSIKRFHYDERKNSHVMA